MATILPVRGIEPKFGKDCFIADNATVVGEVTMGNNCSVWFNAVVRGDAIEAVTARGRLFEIGSKQIEQGDVHQAKASASRGSSVKHDC